MIRKVSDTESRRRALLWKIPSALKALDLQLCSSGVKGEQVIEGIETGDIFLYACEKEDQLPGNCAVQLKSPGGTIYFVSVEDLKKLGFGSR